MKLLYKVKSWKGKVPLGSRFSVKNDDSRKFIRKVKGWASEKTGEYCTDNNAIDELYLSGSYNIIK